MPAKLSLNDLASVTAGFANDVRLVDVPLFMVAQVAGGLSATYLFRWLIPGLPSVAERVVVPH
jgi:hypothetical protein